MKAKRPNATAAQWGRYPVPTSLFFADTRVHVHFMLIDGHLSMRQKRAPKKRKEIAIMEARAVLLLLALLALVGPGAAFRAPGLSLRRVSVALPGTSRRSKTTSISMQVQPPASRTVASAGASVCGEHVRWMREAPLVFQTDPISCAVCARNLCLQGSLLHSWPSPVRSMRCRDARTKEREGEDEAPTGTMYGD